MNRAIRGAVASLALASVARAQFVPVPLTPGSFTYAVVVPSNAPNILPYSITATTGSGTSEGDNTLFEQTYYAKAGATGQYVGVPFHNTTFININNTNCSFLMPPTYLTNNTLQVDSTHTSGTFILATPTVATSLAILSGGAGAGNVNYSVVHSDGSNDTGTLALHDWFTPNGGQIAWGCNGRVTSGNTLSIYSTGTNTSNPYMYSYYVNITDTNPITSIVFTWSTVNEGNFWAVSGTTNGTNYVPIPVTGFNQKCIAPAYVYPSYPLTATMDNGTNITAGANTWFERGYYPPATADGLPPSGSTFASKTQPTHMYQMGNYSTNCGVLIDVNHKSNNIVPANPKPYTAFAFLTAGGNVGTGKKMTNICILQHQGGINETNQFIGYDWFESTVPNSVAYSANGRVSMNGTSLSPNGVSFNNIGNTYPQLFETYFSLTDTNDTVTNIVVLYGSAPGANSTTFIMAVSATAGGVAPLVSSLLPSTQTWYVGQTATIAASVSGTQPISNLWEQEVNGAYVPVSNGVQADGSIISGANTSTLTISNLQFAESTNYEYFASNVVGGASAGPVSVTVLNDSLATAVSIVSQNPPASVSSISIFTNQAAEAFVTINTTASPPISYQWYSGVPQSPANAIPSATNATFTFSNLNNVTLSCIASNIGGTATSSPVTILDNKTPLTSPAAYQAALLAYNPVGYWPLTETSGSIAYDLVGNNDGVYVGSCTLGNPGVANLIGFGSNTSVGFDGSSAYVDIAVNNLNITGPMTVIEWVQTTGEFNNTDYNDAYFSTSLGHGNSGYRFDVDESGDVHFADASPDDISTKSVADGNWHQLVGVYDGTYEYLYVDGTLSVSNIAGTPTGSTEDVWIGGEAQYGTEASNPSNDRLFYGNIAQVCIMTNALTGTQVSNLYGTLGSAATVSAITHPATGVAGDAPATPAIYAGSTLTLTAVVSGTAPVGLQWYSIDTFNNSNNISGATNLTYTISNATTALNGYSFGIDAANSFGTNTDEVQLTVQDAGPFLPTGGDISPLVGEAYVGAPVTYTVTAFGSQPLYYQWSVDGTNVSGATNSTFTAPALCGLHTNQVSISNAFGGGTVIESSQATLLGDAYPTNITFTNGATWQLNGNPQDLMGTVLEVTDGNNSEASTAFYPIAQYVGNFTASFTYTASGNRTADGAAFILQNNSAGTMALGAAGGGLGYSGITDSAALEINIYSANGVGGVGIAAATNGLVAEVAPTGSISVNGGDPINFSMTWLNGHLALTLTDLTSLATYSINYPLGSLTPILGGTDLAYIGFSGGTGGLTAIQTISNFEFNSVIPSESLTVSSVTAGSFVLSWPAVDPNFVLQQSPDLLNWSPGPSSIVVGALNEATVSIPPGGGQTFYRLARLVCP